MRIEKRIDLYKLNTMHLHSMAEVAYYPETNEDLRELISQFGSHFILLAAGSNLLLPAHLSIPVISLMSLNNEMEIDGGKVRVGCSVRVQQLIRFLQKHHLGGIEYLYSVPASVGGLVYMNGGRGKSMNMAISDYLDSVEYLDLDDMTVKTYDVSLLDFTYRHSPFQDMNVIILSACFNFISQSPEITETKIKERLDYSKKHLSGDKPSCGSVFKNGNRIVYRLLRGMKVGGAMFSKKTSNWISNVDDASYDDVCKLIKRAQLLHKLFFSSCQLEIKIIKE